MTDATKTDKVIRLHTLAVDGWSNLVTGIGRVGRDKREHSTFSRVRELTRDHIDAIYRGDAIGARIIDTPARDMLRAWFQINVATVDEEEKAITPEDAAAIASGVQDKLRDLRARREIGRALKWARLYGGGVVVIGAKDATDLEKPVDLAKLEEIVWLRALTRHQVTPGPDVEDFESEFFGQPETYQIHAFKDSPTVHASRIMRFDGVEVAEDSLRAQADRSWGDSIFQRVYEALRDFNGGYDSASTLMQDFAQVVWGIPELHNLVAQNREDLVQSRVAIQDFVRSVINAVLIDPTMGETFERKATPVTGLPELLDRLGIKLSAASGMPLSLLLGIAPRGFANEDRSGQDNWDDVISSMQEENLRHELEKLIGLVMASKAGPTDGVVPETWGADFNALTQQTESEKATTRKTMAETDAIYVDREIVSTDEIAASRFGSDGFSVETHLDREAREEFAKTEGERDLEAEAAEKEAAIAAAVEKALAARAALPPPPAGPPVEPPEPPPPPGGEEPTE